MEESNKNKDKFDYSYSAPDSEEKRWIESIRRQYLPEDEHDAKIAAIKAMHKKVKGMPKCVSVCIGVAGTLILGVGMSMCLQWNQIIGGIIVGLFGMAVMILAYPIYQLLLERGKKKYGESIVRLADELQKDGETIDE